MKKFSLDYSLILKDVDIQRVIEKAAGYKIFVENNGQASALARLWFSRISRVLAYFVFVLVISSDYTIPNNTFQLY